MISRVVSFSRYISVLPSVTNALKNKFLYRSLSIPLNSPIIEQSAEINKVNYISIIDNDNKLQFGDYSTIASQEPLKRIYSNAKDLGISKVPALGELVWVRGRISSVRARGNACFIVLRSGTSHTIQACLFKEQSDPDTSKLMLKYISSLPLETIVDIQGTITAATVKSCTQKNVEIQIQKAFVVSRAPVVLPFILDDASRSETEITSSHGTERPFASVPQV